MATLTYTKWVKPRPIAETTTPAPSDELNAHRFRHTATVDAPLDNIPIAGLEFIIGSSSGLSDGQFTNPDNLTSSVPFDSPQVLPGAHAPMIDPRSSYAYGYTMSDGLGATAAIYKYHLSSRTLTAVIENTSVPSGDPEFGNFALKGPSGEYYERFGQEDWYILRDSGYMVGTAYGAKSHGRDTIVVVDIDTAAIVAEAIYTGTDFTDNASTPVQLKWAWDGTKYWFMYIAGSGENKFIVATWTPGAATIIKDRQRTYTLPARVSSADPDNPGDIWLSFVDGAAFEVEKYDYDADTFTTILDSSLFSDRLNCLAYRKPAGAENGVLVVWEESTTTVKCYHATTGALVDTLALPTIVGSSAAGEFDFSDTPAFPQTDLVGIYGSVSENVGLITVASDGTLSIDECPLASGAPSDTFFFPKYEPEVGAFFTIDGTTFATLPWVHPCGPGSGLDSFTLGFWIEEVGRHFLGWTDVDASTLTDTLYGFQSDDISFQRDLQAIREVFDFYIDDHDGAITCARAADSGTPDVTLTLADMIPQGGVYVTTTVAEKDTLPHAVQVEFTDAESLYIRRHAEPAVLQHLPLAPNRIRKFSIPFAMIEKDVKALQWRLLWNLWAASTTFTLTVTAANMDITVGTVVQFPHDETSTYFSAGEVTAADMRPDDTQVLTLKGIQIDKAIETTGSPIAFTSLAPTWANQASQYIHLDLPYQGTFAADLGGAGIVQYGIVTSAVAYVWNGGKIYRSDDDGGTFVQIHSQTLSPFLGTVATPLATGSPFAGLDDTTTLVIQMLAGDLGDLVDLSIGEAQAGTAKIAYGAPGRWEIIYAATMVHAGDGVVNVTNLYRGMEGSEWAASQHVAGDFAVLLDMSITAAQEFDVFGLEFDSDSEIVTDRQYKGTGSLQSPSAVDPVTRALTGMSHKSPAPHYLRATLISGGDIVLEWLRRDRLTDQADYGELVAPPLSEDPTEIPLVDVEILESDQTTLIRSKPAELAVGTDPEYAVTYTAAEIAADADTYIVGDDISFRVRHVTTFDNDETLAGHWATVTVPIQAEV